MGRGVGRSLCAARTANASAFRRDSRSLHCRPRVVKKFAFSFEVFRIREEPFHTDHHPTRELTIMVRKPGFRCSFWILVAAVLWCLSFAAPANADGLTGPPTPVSVPAGVSVSTAPSPSASATVSVSTPAASASASASSSAPATSVQASASPTPSGTSTSASASTPVASTSAGTNTSPTGSTDVNAQVSTPAASVQTFAGADTSGAVSVSAQVESQTTQSSGSSSQQTSAGSPSRGSTPPPAGPSAPAVSSPHSNATARVSGSPAVAGSRARLHIMSSPHRLSPLAPELTGLPPAVSPSAAQYLGNLLLTQARISAKGEGASAPAAPAPPAPTAPQGAGAPWGAAASGGVFFGLFAVFLAFLLLAAPGVRRWLRFPRELIKPPALQFLLERPG